VREVNNNGSDGHAHSPGVRLAAADATAQADDGVERCQRWQRTKRDDGHPNSLADEKNNDAVDGVGAVKS